MGVNMGLWGAVESIQCYDHQIRLTITCPDLSNANNVSRAFAGRSNFHDPKINWGHLPCFTSDGDVINSNKVFYEGPSPTTLDFLYLFLQDNKNNIDNVDYWLGVIKSLQKNPDHNKKFQILYHHYVLNFNTSGITLSTATESARDCQKEFFSDTAANFSDDDRTMTIQISSVNDIVNLAKFVRDKHAYIQNYPAILEQVQQLIKTFPCVVTNLQTKQYNALFGPSKNLAVQNNLNTVAVNPLTIRSKLQSDG